MREPVKLDRKMAGMAYTALKECRRFSVYPDAEEALRFFARKAGRPADCDAFLSSANFTEPEGPMGVRTRRALPEDNVSLEAV